MKAVILAGGSGTRARPFTDYIPKAMIPVGGRPLIDYIVKYLGKFDFIEEIIIISDFNRLGGQIKNYFQNYPGKISFVQDAGHGTGGDLLYAAKKLGRDSEFVLWFADNLCAVNLTKMVETFQAKQSDACIATRNLRREETGFAVVKHGIIEEFFEKPIAKLPMSECLGVYVLGKVMIQKIKSKRKKNVNLSYDILQQSTKVSAFDIGHTPWMDVQSPVSLERHRDMVADIIKQMES